MHNQETSLTRDIYYWERMRAWVDVGDYNEEAHAALYGQPVLLQLRNPVTDNAVLKAAIKKYSALVNNS